MDREAKIVIVGAGIVGSAIAFQLTRRHRNVTIVDSGPPGSGATLASYAWINSRDKSPRQYHDLNRRSLDMWQRFARQLNDDIGLRWGGEMRWSATGPGAESLLARAEELRSWGYPVIEVTKDQARVMEPGVVMEPFTSAVYCEIEGHVDTQRTVRVCLNRVQQAGGELIANDAVAAINRYGNRDGSPGEKPAIRSVTLAGGRELPCDVLVLAAGYETTGLAAMTASRSSVPTTQHSARGRSASRAFVAGSSSVNQRVRPGSGASGSMAISSKKLSLPDCMTQLWVLMAVCLLPMGTVTPKRLSKTAMPCGRECAPMAKWSTLLCMACL